MTRSADLFTRLSDDARIRSDRAAAKARFEAKFAPAKAKAAANAKFFSTAKVGGISLA